jgi:hypothetical protein
VDYIILKIKTKRAFSSGRRKNMKIFNNTDVYKVVDKLAYQGVYTQIDFISKSTLEFEVDNFEWEIPYYGVEKEIAKHLKNKLSLLARDYNYPINKDTTLVLGIDKDIDGDLKVIIDNFRDTYKDMDNICLVFEK